MKPQTFAFLAGFLLLIAVVLLIPGGPSQSQANKAATPPERLVTVTGEGEVRVKPDLALVTMGILTHGASAGDAEALNLAFVKQIETAMVAAGADDGSPEVTQTALTTTTYQDYTGATRISGFETRTSVRVAVRSVAKVQAVVDAALASGATSVEGISYTLEKPEDAKENAMKQALANAHVRAGALVKAEDEKIGDLKSMEVLATDSPANAPSPTNLVFKAQVRATFGY